MSSWITAHETLVQTALITSLLGYSIQLAARSGALSLAGVGFYGIAGFGAAKFVKDDWPTWGSIILVVAGCAVIGLFLSLVFARVRGLHFAMGTLAFTLFIQTLSTTWTTYTGGTNGVFGVPLVMTTAGLTVMVAIVAAYACVTEYGSSGRKLRLLQEDEMLAASLGVRIRRERALAVVLSAVCGAAAGAGQSLTFGYFAPGQVSFAVVTNAVVIMVIGGSTTWFGPIVGAFILAWLPEWVSFAGDWRALAQGLAALIIIVLAPRGVLGIVSDLIKLGIGPIRRRLAKAPPPPTPSEPEADNAALHAPVSESGVRS